MVFARAMDHHALLGRLWQQGVSIDDHGALSAARAHASGALHPTASADLELFAGWLAASQGSPDPAIDPAHVSGAASRLLGRAVALRAASNRRDVAAIGQAMSAIDREMAELDGGDPRGAVARAAIDLALAETAVLSRDLRAAGRCLKRVAVSGPPAFRVAALERQVTLLLAREHLPTALTRARQAIALAAQLERPLQAVHSRFLLGLVAYLLRDADTMRAALLPLAATPEGYMARVLLTGLEPPEQALLALTGSLQVAAERRDPMGYAICALIGGRSYVRIGRLTDALITTSAACKQLRDVAPELVVAIEDETEAWRHEWGGEPFAAAQREAMAALTR